MINHPFSFVKISQFLLSERICVRHSLDYCLLIYLNFRQPTLPCHLAVSSRKRWLLATRQMSTLRSFCILEHLLNLHVKAEGDGQQTLRLFCDAKFLAVAALLQGPAVIHRDNIGPFWFGRGRKDRVKSIFSPFWQDFCQYFFGALMFCVIGCYLFADFGIFFFIFHFSLKNCTVFWLQLRHCMQTTLAKLLSYKPAQCMVRTFP